MVRKRVKLQRGHQILVGNNSVSPLRGGYMGSHLNSERPVGVEAEVSETAVRKPLCQRELRG